MTTKDHEVQSTTFRRLLALGLVTILPVAVILAVLITREDGQVTRPTLAPSSTAVIPTTTTLDTRTELTRRLVEILKIRDKAFQERDRQILKGIYTVDCPCLEGDGNAIQELVDNNYHIVGGATSIRLRRVSMASERLWLVVADFDPHRYGSRRRMANWFEKSLEVANYSNLPCLNQMVLANGFLVEQRPIRMAPDELALEISNSRVDLHGHCFIQPGDACFSFIG